MTTCPKCQNPVDDGSAECPYCGVILSKVKAQAPLGPEFAGQQAAGEMPPENVYSAPESTFAEGQVPMGGTVDGAVTRATLEALRKAKPWMTFLVWYGYILLFFVILGCLAVVAVTFTQPEPGTLGLVVVYLFYSLLILAFILPLKRAAKAIGNLGVSGVSAGVEDYAVNVGVFFRRVGLVTVIGIVLMLVAIVVVIGAGAFFAAQGG